jgi:hypothetical protein
MRHPQLQARKPVAQAPAVADVFTKVVQARLDAVTTDISARIGVIVTGGERQEYVVDFASGQVRGGHEWLAVTEDPDLDVVVRVDEVDLQSAMTNGKPPALSLVHGHAAALAPLLALLRSASA